MLIGHDWSVVRKIFYSVPCLENCFTVYLIHSYLDPAVLGISGCP